MTITFFDVLILFGLIGGAIMGFYRGLVRQAAATLILYISIVLASLAYLGVSRTLARLTGQPTPATDVLAFFLLMAVAMFLLFLGRRDLMRGVKDKIPIWQNITGMVFGVLNAAIICAVVLIVVRSVSSGDPWPGYDGVRVFMRRQVTRSFLAFIFRPFTHLILNLIEPWLFGGQLPPLLRNAL